MSKRNSKILEEFAQWLEVSSGLKSNSASNYCTGVNAVNRDLSVAMYNFDFIAQLDGGQMIKSEFLGELSTLQGILGNKFILNSHENKKLWQDRNSHFSKFIEFLQDKFVVSTAKTPTVQQFLIIGGAPNQSCTYPIPNSDLYYDKTTLTNTLKSRVKTQDRQPKNKVYWFPIRVLNRIFRDAPQRISEQGEFLKKLFDKIIDGMVNRIVFITSELKYTFNQIDGLLISNGVVYVIVNGRRIELLTKGPKGNYSPMVAESINGIELDHTHRMEDMLKDYGRNGLLEAIGALTVDIKQKCLSTKCKGNYGKVYGDLLTDNDWSQLMPLLPNLLAEFALLSTNTELVAMAKNDNRAKG